MCLSRDLFCNPRGWEYVFGKEEADLLVSNKRATIESNNPIPGQGVDRSTRF